MTYDINYPPYFERKIKKYVKKKNRQLREVLDEALESLESDPKQGSIKLRYDLKGKRRIKVKNSKFRIIYTICKECRELGEENLNECSICEETDDFTVILRNFDLRKKIYNQQLPPV